MVTKVVVSHPHSLAWIAKDSRKCDKVDAKKLADLLRCGLTHEVFLPVNQARRTFKQLVRHFDEATRAQRLFKFPNKSLKATDLIASGATRRKTQTNFVSLTASGQFSILRRNSPDAIKFIAFSEKHPNFQNLNNLLERCSFQISHIAPICHKFYGKITLLRTAKASVFENRIRVVRSVICAKMQKAARQVSKLKFVDD